VARIFKDEVAMLTCLIASILRSHSTPHQTGTYAPRLCAAHREELNGDVTLKWREVMCMRCMMRLPWS